MFRPEVCGLGLVVGRKEGTGAEVPALRGLELMGVCDSMLGGGGISVQACKSHVNYA